VACVCSYDNELSGYTVNKVLNTTAVLMPGQENISLIITNTVFPCKVN